MRPNLVYSLRRARSIWSKLNKKKALALTESGRMTEAGMTGINEAMKNSRWDSAYSSRKKEEIPPDLERALKEDNNAWSNF